MNTAIKVFLLIAITLVAGYYLYKDKTPERAQWYEPLFENHGPGPEKISLSDEQWKQRLTPEQYEILRENGTEPAYSGTLYNNKQPGIYACAACSLPLFSSRDKYDSHTGWPSFTKPIDPSHVLYHEDDLLWIKRIEVACARCDSHLGHVFNDGPPPTGLRYCMNGLALTFEPKANNTQISSRFEILSLRKPRD